MIIPKLNQAKENQTNQFDSKIASTTLNRYTINVVEIQHTHGCHASFVSELRYISMPITVIRIFGKYHNLKVNFTMVKRG